jgi:hypothetical protein
MAGDDQIKNATQTYRYGYPLVYSMDEIAKLPAGGSVIGEMTPRRPGRRRR